MILGHAGVALSDAVAGGGRIEAMSRELAHARSACRGRPRDLHHAGPLGVLAAACALLFPAAAPGAARPLAQIAPAAPARPATSGVPCVGTALCPWPAEPPALAVNLTSIEGPGTNDFHVDMSGAFWDPYAPALWVCRNGGTGGSKVWKLVPDGAGSFAVGTVAGARAEWSGFGDCEAIALATFAEPSTVYTVEEASSSIREWDLSTSAASLQRSWNLAAFVPTYAGGLGIEGLTFVPDDHLAAFGFVGADGQPRTSRLGMGALAFVGHQNGGRVYVFDLDRGSGSFDFVGAYATGDPETAELTYDPTVGRLYAWHGDGRNDLEVLELTSQPQGTIRAFDRRAMYDYPGTANDEGFAIQWTPGGCAGVRGAFVLTDGGGGELAAVVP